MGKHGAQHTRYISLHPDAVNSRGRLAGWQALKHGAMRVQAGSAIMTQGEENGREFYIIAEGEAAVVVDGKEVAVRTPGEYVGEIALFTDAPRTASIVPIGEVKCLVMERGTFLRLFGKVGALPYLNTTLAKPATYPIT